MTIETFSILEFAFYGFILVNAFNIVAKMILNIIGY